MITSKIKQLAYFGFANIFISPFIAHIEAFCFSGVSKIIYSRESEALREIVFAKVFDLRKTFAFFITGLKVNSFKKLFEELKRGNFRIFLSCVLYYNDLTFKNINRKSLQHFLKVPC